MACAFSHVAEAFGDGSNGLKMSQSIISAISSQISGDTIAQIASQVGVSPEQAQGAVGVALPTLVAALAGNASSGSGAGALLGALQRDHGGANLGGLLGSIGSLASSGGGASILGHVLGNNQSAAAAQIGERTGLSASQITSILGMLAPIVMGYLGKRQQDEGLDAAGLQRVLGQERQVAQQQLGGDALGGVLGSLLGGAGGSGDLKQELVGQGLKALGGLFGKK